LQSTCLVEDFPCTLFQKIVAAILKVAAISSA
jgi:hypothetical protein